MADDKPWYRQFWPWFVMAPPAASVIGGVLLAVLAGGPPSLVVDDYGQIAMATEAREARDARALALGLRGRLELGGDANADQRIVTLQMTGATGWSPPAHVNLLLTHPTIEARDQRAVLERRGREYRGKVARPDGRYYVQIEDTARHWRLSGTLAAGARQLELAAAGPGVARAGG